MSMSVFFYLTDVDMSCGARVAVRGTHQRKTLRHLWSPMGTRTDEEILQAYGRSRWSRSLGPLDSDSSKTDIAITRASTLRLATAWSCNSNTLCTTTERRPRRHTEPGRL